MLRVHTMTFCSFMLAASVSWSVASNNPFSATSESLTGAKAALTSSNVDILMFEQYVVNSELTLPYVGVQDPNSNVSKIIPVNGYVTLKKGANGALPDGITVIDEFMDPATRRKMVRLGLDFEVTGNKSSAPSDIFMTSEDFEILVNDSQNQVTALVDGVPAIDHAEDVAGPKVSKRQKHKNGGMSKSRKGRSLCGGKFANLCFRQVKLWLFYNGFVNSYMDGASAIADGPRALKNHGFRKVGTTPSSTYGTVCVYTRGGNGAGRIYGHIEVYNGSQWEGSGCRSYPMTSAGRSVYACYRK